MGTIGNAMKSAMSASYKIVFGFHAEPAKGMIISQSLVPATMFFSSASRPILAGSNDDEAVMLALLQIRKFRHVKIAFPSTNETQKMVRDMMDLNMLGASFKASLGVSRFAFGKKTATYILRDFGAKFHPDGLFAHGYNTSGNGYVIQINFERPELLHGVGEGFNVKKV